MLTLFQPVWLLLLLPLTVAVIVWPLPSRLLRGMRVVVFVLVVLALAQLAVRLPDRAGTLVVVADRSESMPANATGSQTEIIALLQKSMKPRDWLGVVSFGRRAVVERAPQRGEFTGFTAQVGGDHSSLNDAIESALSLVPLDAAGKILVLSDGRWTGQDPLAAAARAAGRGVAVDYRLLSRPQVGDVAIQNLLLPDSVLPGQAFVASVWVQSPTEQAIQYQFRRGDVMVAAGERAVSAGLSRLMFRDRAPKAGVSEYTVTIRGDQDDAVPENNSARALVTVEGARPVLLVSTAGEDSGLARLLRSGGVDVLARHPARCEWSLEKLSQYSAVVLENVPANQIGSSGMETLASWVEETGSGMAMTGGQKSYGPGGYFKSPLERVLPISMEMRREHRKLQLAIVVALDRSGSMARPAGGGRNKMDLANLGTVQVLDLLSPMDEFGVIAVDSSPHEIVAMDSVEKNAGLRGKILSIDSMGGGIFIFEALKAAARMVSSAEAGTKHIILFADAADSEEPGDYINLVEKLRDAEVTVSVIGLGTEGDQDADLLKDIARRGGGECYFTSDPDEIPRLFAQDTFAVARSTFVDQPTGFALTGGYSLLGTAPAVEPPPLGGYNLCYLRPEANLAAVTRDDYQAPVVASWNAGNGRVLCFLGEADGKFAGALAGWDQAGEFYATLSRWVAGRRQPLPDGLLLNQQVRDGACVVQLHLDPERKGDPFAALPRVKVLHGTPGTVPQKESVALQWKDADLLEISMPIIGWETMLNTVEIVGQSPVTLPPVCLPYSPEFVPDQPGRGGAALAEIAAVTGGHEAVEIPRLWDELPVKSRYVELAPWLLVASAILFLLEVFERRTGWLSRLIFRAPKPVAAATVETGEMPAGSVVAKSAIASKSAFNWLLRKRVQPVPALGLPKAAKLEGPAAVVPQSAPKPDLAESSFDAMRKARERASRRTEKNP